MSIRRMTFWSSGCREMRAARSCTAEAASASLHRPSRGLSRSNRSDDWARYLEKRVTDKVLNQVAVFQLVNQDATGAALGHERKLTRQRLENEIAKLKSEFDQRIAGLQVEIDRLKRGLVDDRGAVVDLPNPLRGRRVA